MGNYVMVGEQVSGEAAKVRKQLEKIITDTNKSAFDISDLLHQIKKKGFYNEWGYNTFQEFVGTLDIKTRKAQYLQRMAAVMETVGIAREVYEPVGIAKLREITSLDPEANWTNPETQEVTPMAEFIKGFVEKAADMDLDAIKQHVRTLKGFTGSNDLVWRNICFIRQVAEGVIDPAVQLAKNHIGSVAKDDEGISVDASDGKAWEYIAADFMSDPANSVLPESEG